MGNLKEGALAAGEIKKSFARDPKLKRFPIHFNEEEGHLLQEGLAADTEQKRLLERKLHSLLEEYGRDLTAVENEIRLEGVSGEDPLINSPDQGVGIGGKIPLPEGASHEVHAIKIHAAERIALPGQPLLNLIWEQGTNAGFPLLFCHARPLGSTGT